MHLYESLGLGLLLAAVVVGLLSLWLNSETGQTLALHFPRLSGLLHSTALMVLMMVAGACLLLLGIFRTPTSAPPAALVNRPGLPAGQVPANRADLQLKPTPVPMAVELPPSQPVAAENSHGPTAPPPMPAKPAPTLPHVQLPPPAINVPPKAKSATDVRPEVIEVPNKKNIFGARCARLLEKVGAGEPMTPQEQHEMVSKCQ